MTLSGNTAWDPFVPFLSLFVISPCPCVRPPSGRGLAPYPDLQATFIESKERQRLLPAYCLTFVLYSVLGKLPGVCDASLVASLAAYTKLNPKPALLRALWT